MSILTDHLTPDPLADPKHYLRGVSDGRDAYVLRCETCDKTLVLPKPQPLPGQAPTALPPRAGEHCPDHIGGRLGSCPGCRADELGLADPHSRPSRTPVGADPRMNQDWRQMRDQLAGKSAKDMGCAERRQSEGVDVPEVATP